MREKRLRQQETGEQLLPSAAAEASQNQTASVIQKRKVPAKTSPASPEPSVTSSTAPIKVCKLLSLRVESPSPKNRTASPDATAEASVPEGPGSPSHPESQSCSREVPDKNTSTSTPQCSTRVSQAAQQAADNLQHRDQTRTSEHPEVSKGTGSEGNHWDLFNVISNQHLTCSRHQHFRGGPGLR